MLGAAKYGIVGMSRRKERTMDARELTKKVTEQENRLYHLEKEVVFLREEVEKLRLLMGDIEIDVKMMQKR